MSTRETVAMDSPVSAATSRTVARALPDLAAIHAPRSALPPE
ncbi:hypothetical protein ACIBO5_14085 [Nonomuraea angiospora]